MCEPLWQGTRASQLRRKVYALTGMFATFSIAIAIPSPDSEAMYPSWSSVGTTSGDNVHVLLSANATFGTNASMNTNTTLTSVAFHPKFQMWVRSVPIVLLHIAFAWLTLVMRDYYSQVGTQELTLELRQGARSCPQSCSSEQGAPQVTPELAGSPREGGAEPSWIREFLYQFSTMQTEPVATKGPRDRFAAVSLLCLGAYIAETLACLVLMTIDVALPETLSLVYFITFFTNFFLFVLLPYVATLFVLCSKQSDYMPLLAMDISITTGALMKRTREKELHETVAAEMKIDELKLLDAIVEEERERLARKPCASP